MSAAPYAPYRGPLPFVFVSYSHADTDAVFSDLDLLGQQGFRLWFDEGITPGAHWRDEIAHAIRNASLVLFFATPNSGASEHCKREINFALDIGRPIASVLLEDTPLPDGIRFALGGWQSILKYELSASRYTEVLINLVLDHVGQADEHAVALDVERPATQDAAAADAQRKLLVVPIPGSDDAETVLDAIVEEIVVGLSRSKWLRVIDSSTTFALKRSEEDPLTLARSVGAGYVLHGRARALSADLRITFYLSDTATGDIVWSDVFEGTSDQLLHAEQDIKHRVLASIEPEYLNHQSHIITSGSSSLQQWELVLKARQLFWKTTRATTEEARSLLLEAIELDPEDGRAWGLLTMTHLNDIWNGWSDALAESLRNADRASQEALRIDNTDPAAHHIRSAYTGTIGDFGQAFADLEKALELNPFFAAALGDMSRLCAFAGRSGGATEYAQRAIDASPKDPHVGLWCYWVALNHYVGESYIDALIWLEKAASFRPDWVIVNMLKSVCLALLGQEERAGAVLTAISEASRTYALRTLRISHPFQRDEPIERYLGALRTAGLSDAEIALADVRESKSKSLDS